MDLSKRKFLKALPVAAALPLSINGITGNLTEIKKSKRYIFSIPTDMLTREHAQVLRSILADRGYGDVLIVNDVINIYELEK